MKYIYSKLYMLMAFSIPLSLSAEDNQIPNREMIITLDYQSEEAIDKTLQMPSEYASEILPQGMGAITFTTIIALNQEAAPVLTSTSLIKNIVDHKNLFMDFVNNKVSNLYKCYKQYPRFQTVGSIKTFKRHCVYTHNIFNQVNRKLNILLNKLNEKELDQVLDGLTSDRRFSQYKAPQGLWHLDNQACANMHREMMIYTMCWQISFDNWIIKKVSDDLLLLVPKNYLKKYNLEQSTEYKNMLDLSDLEKTFGLKLNHLEDITDINSLKAASVVNYQEKKSTTFSQDLGKIFVINYSADSKEKPVWALYMSGHGLPRRNLHKTIEQLKSLEQLYSKKAKYSRRARTKISHIQDHIRRLELQAKTYMKYQDGIILSLSFDDFYQSLKFFNDNITIAFLFYSSCYAGGEHLVIPYCDADKKPLILNFTVVSGTLAENKAQQDVPLIMLPPYGYKTQGRHTIIQGINTQAIDIKRHKLALATTLYFENFFNSLRAGEHKNLGNLHKIISHLHPYVHENNSLMVESLGNIPSIRPAGSSSFNIISNVPPCIALTPELVEKHDFKRRWILGSKEVALLYTDYIPQTVILNKKSATKPPIFVSMMPYAIACHVFEQVVARNYTFEELIDAFLKLPELKGSKIFWIKKLKCANSPNLPYLGQQLNDVIIVRNTCTTDIFESELKYEDQYLVNNVYLTADNIHYKATLKNSTTNTNILDIKQCSSKNYQNELLALAPELKPRIRQKTYQA